MYMNLHYTCMCSVLYCVHAAKECESVVNSASEYMYVTNDGATHFDACTHAYARTYVCTFDSGWEQ